MKLLQAIAAGVIGCVAVAAQATVLTHVDVSVTGTGGAGGSGTAASDMVYANYQTGDGWGWAGGAGAVQGNKSTNAGGGNAAAANEALRFNVGSAVDSLNSTYGAGNWAISSPTLSFASAYFAQNNGRFGVGTGTFDIYWVKNDAWAQSAGTPTDRALNPVYASNAIDLKAWSGDQSLLGSETFTVPGPDSTRNTYKFTYGLSSDSAFLSDITSATATSNPGVSLYLMGTSDTIGMIIYTGGQTSVLPTLSFDVVSVPEPATLGLAAGAAMLLMRRRRP